MSQSFSLKGFPLINILRSSSWTEWQLRNIHISNDNESFSCRRTFIPDLTILVTRRVFYSKQELLTSRKQLGSPPTPVFIFYFLLTFNFSGIFFALDAYCENIWCKTLAIARLKLDRTKNYAFILKWKNLKT